MLSIFVFILKEFDDENGNQGLYERKVLSLGVERACL